MTEFGSYISFGKPRKRKWESATGTLTVGFWRITLCFARLDIEHLFSDVLGDLKAQDRQENRAKRLEENIKHLQEDLRKEVELNLDLNNKVSKLDAHTEELDDEVTDLEEERRELKKTVDSERTTVHNLLLYFNLISDDDDKDK